jgi:hypothetical protein
MANINEIDAAQKIAKFKKGQQIIKGAYNKDSAQYASAEDTAERAAVKEQIKNANRINISDDKEIKIPEGELAADFYGYEPVAIKDKDGNVVGVQVDELTENKLFNARNGYPQIDALEDYVKSLGGTLVAYMDNDANLIFAFSTREVNKNMFADYLIEHKIPFSQKRKPKTKEGIDEGIINFIIKETELKEFFPEYANVESPIIRHLINEAGNINAATTDTVAARQKISKALAGAIDKNAIARHAQKVYDEITTILASNPEQVAMLNRFDKLSVDEKQKLANFIVKGYARLKGMPAVPVEPDFDLGGAGCFSGFDQPLLFKPSSQNVSTASGFVGTIAHEYAGHAADGFGKGFLNARQMQLSDLEDGVSAGLMRANKQWDKVVDKLAAQSDAGQWYDITELDEADKVLEDAQIAYRAHLTEQVATAISDLFEKNSNRFISDVCTKARLLQERTSGRVW